MLFFAYEYNSGWKKPNILASTLNMVTKSAISPQQKLQFSRISIFCVPFSEFSDFDITYSTIEILGHKISIGVHFIIWNFGALRGGGPQKDFK